ncbi:hypothetical protein XALC_1137 [Xanthomonas albilineans GPE PC73]|uniref:Uncharacterized protein n=1 Tax=Xanthomonas albilineans (strain GPE PC73 / CFBP 7063) TaxID=380358 RepID=D2U8D6_XANAP|nr:hypothetical protein XALC_1137 [Xanthomonas albilineans GPE PC73]
MRRPSHVCICMVDVRIDDARPRMFLHGLRGHVHPLHRRIAPVSVVETAREVTHRVGLGRWNRETGATQRFWQVLNGLSTDLSLAGFHTVD